MLSEQLDDKHAIITPEIVKVWDNTWDCLVNENFLDKPNDYQKTNNPYKDSGIKGDISVETVVCEIRSTNNEIYWWMVYLYIKKYIR